LGKEDPENNDPRVIWEFLKFKSREFTIKYSKEKAKNSKLEVKSLEKTIRSLENSTETLCKTEKETLLSSKLALEDYYDYVTQGTILRSKCTWYEEGEKNSKYFLNLEKRNKSKSTVQKLIVNESEISNPSEILREIKNFYTDKYSKKSKNNLPSCKKIPFRN
jgi:hypothetical protein